MASSRAATAEIFSSRASVSARASSHGYGCQRSGALIRGAPLPVASYQLSVQNGRRAGSGTEGHVLNWQLTTGNCRPSRLFLSNPYGAHLAELVVAEVQPRLHVECLRRLQRAAERGIEKGRRRGGIRVGATGGFLDDLVDDAEREEVGRGDLQRFGRFHLAAGVAPENRGTALRRNHAVDRELVHQD